MSNINITGIITPGDVLYTRTSLSLDDIEVTLTLPGDVPTTREIQLPPWLQITNGPPDQWESNTGGGPGGTGTIEDLPTVPPEIELPTEEPQMPEFTEIRKWSSVAKLYLLRL
jgi:hypothetical protein